MTEANDQTYFLGMTSTPSVHNASLWSASRFWIRSIALLSMGVSLAAFLMFVGQHSSSGFDDAYMFIRYAQNFRNGHGIAWNPDGEQTYGVTSLAHFAAVTLAKTVFPGIPNGTLLTLVSTVALLLALVLLAATCARWAASSSSLTSLMAWMGLLFPLLLFSPTIRAHAVTGMDTTLAALSNTALIAATLHWKSRPTPVALGLTILAAYLTYLTRPENLIYAALFPALVIGLMWSATQKRFALLSFGGILALVLSVDTLWKYWLFGDPLPLAFYVKAQGIYDGYLGASLWNPIPYLFEFGKLALPFLLIACACLTRDAWTIPAAFGLPALLLAGYYFGVLQIMGYHARYYLPALPFLVVGAALLLDLALARGFRAFATEPCAVQILRGLSIAGLVFLGFRPGLEAALTKIYELACIPEPTAYVSAIAYATPANARFAPVGWALTGPAMAELLAQFPAGAVVSLSEYGLVGAAAPQVQILDPLGLHDPRIAHQGFSVDDFLGRRPDFIWLPHPHYTKIVAALLSSPDFWNAYDFYPGLFDYGVALRKDSAHAAGLRAAFSAACQHYYGIADISQFRAIPTLPQ